MMMMMTTMMIIIMTMAMAMMICDQDKNIIIEVPSELVMIMIIGDRGG